MIPSEESPSCFNEEDKKHCAIVGRDGGTRRSENVVTSSTAHSASRRSLCSRHRLCRCGQNDSQPYVIRRQTRAMSIQHKSQQQQQQQKAADVDVRSENSTNSLFTDIFQSLKCGRATTPSPDLDSTSLLHRTLPFDPRQWTRDDVSRWLRVHHKEMDIDVSKFAMNGRALCIMTLDMFRYRVGPRHAHILFHDFRRRLMSAVITQCPSFS